MSQSIKNQQILICGVSFAGEIGLNEAILLQQLFYWQRKCGRSEWIYNSHKAWQEQFGYLSLRTIRRTFASLSKQGFLEFKKGKRCKFYRLHYETASKFLLDQDATELHIGEVSYVITKPQAQVMQRYSEEDKLQQMLDIWQRKIPTEGRALTLTPKRNAALQTLLATIFDSKLEQWVNFVDKIAESDFLMGKTKQFKAFLDWAIIPDTCLKILEGAYGHKPTNNQSLALPNKVLEHVNGWLELIEDKDWRETAKLLVQILGAPGYQSWFSKVKFKSYENDCIYLEAETRFISDWIDGHYSHKIRRAWIEATHKRVSSVIIKPGAGLSP